MWAFFKESLMLKIRLRFVCVFCSLFIKLSPGRDISSLTMSQAVVLNSAVEFT